MSVSLALNNTLSGLNINQQALTALSGNIANVRAPAVSKPTLVQSSPSLGGQGEGINPEVISRKIGDYLSKAALSQNSEVEKNNVLAGYYQQIQSLVGTSGNGNGLNASVNNFFGNLQSLSQSPDSNTTQQAVVASGVTVAAKLNQLSQGLSSIQSQVDKDITVAVASVNDSLGKVYALNQSITQATAQGQPVAGLQEQRDSVVKNLSQYINVNTFQKTDGSLVITTSNGTNLVDNNLYQLSYSPETAQLTVNASTPPDGGVDAIA